MADDLNLESGVVATPDLNLDSGVVTSSVPQTAMPTGIPGLNIPPQYKELRGLNEYNPLPMLENAGLHPWDTIKSILQAQGDEGRKAAAKFGTGNYSEALAHGAAYLIPGIGPMISHLGETAGGGQRFNSETGQFEGEATPPDIRTAMGQAAGLGLTLGAGGVGKPKTPLESAIAAKQVQSLRLAGHAQTLTQALNITDEPRAAGTKLMEGIPDVAAQAKETGIPITDSASLELNAANGVRQLQDKINQNIPSAIAKTLTLDGDKIRDAIIGNIPELIRKGKPGMVKSITKEAENWAGPITVEKTKQILSDINADDAKYHAASPADQLRADLQRKYVVNEAVANEIRAQLYPKVAEVSGPGMQELMRRQGNMLMIRNAAHDVANDEYLNPPPNAAIKAIRTGVGFLTGGPTVPKVVGGALDYSAGATNPSAMIKNIFSDKSIPNVSYPEVKKTGVEGIVAAQNAMGPQRPVAGLLPRGPIQMPSNLEAIGTPSATPSAIDIQALMNRQMPEEVAPPRTSGAHVPLASDLMKEFLLRLAGKRGQGQLPPVPPGRMEF